MEMELGNQAKGQVFTPYPVCQMTAKLSFEKKHAQEIISKKGHITLHEPASGGGAMVIAYAETMRDQEINYQKHLHVTAIDVDIKAVCMTYIQLALLHVPAIVIHGNTLSLETWSQWHTPAHIMGGWNRKLTQQPGEQPTEKVPAASEEIETEIELPTPAEIAAASKQPATQQLSLF